MGRKMPAVPVWGECFRSRWQELQRPIGTCPIGRMENRLLIPGMYNSKRCLDDLTFEEF